MHTVTRAEQLRDGRSAWARKAVGAYHTHRADRIVAERNQGGDLVESTIRLVDRSASFTSVHASRGKVVRAEPVSALYEQRRVHHAGVFPQLEEQMSAFTADFNRGQAGYSPNRIDALVCALSELMLGPARECRSRRGGPDEACGGRERGERMMTEREPATLETLAGLIEEILHEMARLRESMAPVAEGLEMLTERMDRLTKRMQPEMGLTTDVLGDEPRELGERPDAHPSDRLRPHPRVSRVPRRVSAG